MERLKRAARTTGLIVVGALIASGVSATFAGEEGAEVARRGVADILVERIIHN